MKNILLKVWNHVKQNAGALLWSLWFGFCFWNLGNLLVKISNNQEAKLKAARQETADLVNRHKKYTPSLMKRGIIPFPTGSQKGGARGWQVRSYYSESQVWAIRDILATYHIGRYRDWETQKIS